MCDMAGFINPATPNLPSIVNTKPNNGLKTYIYRIIQHKHQPPRTSDNFIYSIQTKLFKFLRTQQTITKTNPTKLND